MRRTFVTISAATLAVACADGGGPRPDPTDPGTTPPKPTTPTTPTEPTTPTIPVISRSDGNVLREQLVFRDREVTVAWWTPQGDASLSIVTVDELALFSAFHGHRTLAASDLDFGDGAELIEQVLGFSVLQEARDSLVQLDVG